VPKLAHSRQFNSGDFRRGRTTGSFAVDLNQRMVFEGLLYLKVKPDGLLGYSVEAMLFENSPIRLLALTPT
jgi:hypothetical protein